jgi:hypothetical protein
MSTRYALIAILLGCSAGMAQDKKPEPPARYGVAAETELYPQTSPKTAMISINKAFQRNRIDYLLAHLLEPSFVDDKVVQFYRIKFGKTPELDRDSPNYEMRIKEAFADFMREANKHMTDEPKQSGYLMKLLKEGTIEEGGTTAKVTHKDVPNLALSLRQVDGRWFMMNEDTPPKPKG